MPFDTLIHCRLLSGQFSRCQILLNNLNGNFHALNEGDYLLLSGAWLRLKVGFTGNDVVAVYVVFVVAVVVAVAGLVLPLQGRRGERRKMRRGGGFTGGQIG